MPDRIIHTIAPVFDAQSRILILGTMPSPKSRENAFYYGHPQNCFWRILSAVFEETVPGTNSEKTVFLLWHHIALWDVLQSCDITGADDSSIRNPVPNDLRLILSQADIQAVFTTGKKAAQLYRKLILPETGMPAHELPSTSPANCARTTFEGLKAAHMAILTWV